MGIIVTIIPNVSDYWIQVLNPHQEMLQILTKYQSEITQEVKILTEQRWINLKIASVLLQKVIKEHKIVKQMFEETKRKVFVTRCRKDQTLDPEIYEFLLSQCPQKYQMSPEFQGETQIFMFQRTGNIIDVKTSFEELQTKELPNLPSEYLLLELKNTYKISLFKEGKENLLSESPLNEKMVLNLIKGVAARQDSDEINYTVESIVKQIFEHGNHEKADLLVQDIFGASNCEIIGLPPKLIASSLAKFAKEEKGMSSFWDQSQSLLVAFALNIGLLAKEQIHLTKVKKVVFKTNEISDNRFLSVINTLLAPFGEIIFIKHDIPAICTNKPLKAQK